MEYETSTARINSTSTVLAASFCARCSSSRNFGLDFGSGAAMAAVLPARSAPAINPAATDISERMLLPSKTIRIMVTRKCGHAKYEQHFAFTFRLAPGCLNVAQCVGQSECA